MGFRYGTSSSSLTKNITCSNYNGTASAFGADVTDLTAGTEYYVQASVQVSGQTFTGAVTSFKTESVQVSAVSGKSWLELPGAVSNDNYLVNTYYDDSENDANRNYTHCYDKSTYTSLWTAYHLNSGHLGTGRSDDWSYSPKIDTKYQVNLVSHSYNDGYSKGHMIPNASRNANSTMQSQTFYVTNAVPQVHNGFNNGIWSTLEGDVRQVAKDNDEEIYVVTGVAFSKVGENRTIKYTTAKDDTKQVPVPNYFYKLVLRVKTSDSTVTDAYAVGFWFENKVYSGTTYTSNIKSVNEIEQLTGFDFFVNLPDSVEEKAEGYTSWVNLQAF